MSDHIFQECQITGFIHDTVTWTFYELCNINKFFLNLNVKGICRNWFLKLCHEVYSITRYCHTSTCLIITCIIFLYSQQIYSPYKIACDAVTLADTTFFIIIITTTINVHNSLSLYGNVCSNPAHFISALLIKLCKHLWNMVSHLENPNSSHSTQLGCN